MSESAALSGSEGSVLDPIVAIRHRITLDPEESATIDIVSGIGETRDAVPGPGRRNTRIGVSRIASSIWRGRTARCCCGRSMPRRPTRSSMDAWPARSSTPMPRCAPTRASSSRTAAGNPASGATPFPAICRSCCCRLKIRPISTWCANSCRPTPTGA
ncbi:MAG: hypothetical protein MZW92_27650 [Comamonadaceae bacterium]|nr:hypothetical protein [Comamonadaceae bacterium]